MIISKISLHAFRNYPQREFSFSPGMNFILGENGLGKSNLLEAIFFSATGHSPLCSKDRDMINWKAEKFILRIEGFLGDAGPQHTQSVELNSSGQKKVKVNENESSRLADLLGRFGVVLFLPGDIEIINGGPGLRRQFLDGLMCQFSKNYLDNLRKYKRVLKQRNSLLKEPEKYSLQVKEVLTEQLIEYGSEVTIQRTRFLKNLTEEIVEFYEDISGRQKILTVNYQSTVSEEGENAARFKDDFIQKLKEVRDSEKFQKSTIIGPHRDNLLFLLEERPASEFGSQGQKRLIALSLKLASARILEREFKSAPVLLLDDVFSDLDEQKRIRLGSMIQKRSQIVLAGSRLDDIPFKADNIIKLKQGPLTA